MIGLFISIFPTIVSLNLKIVWVGHMTHFSTSITGNSSEWDNFWFHVSYYQQTIFLYRISFAKYDQLRNLAVNLKAELREKHFYPHWVSTWTKRYSKETKNKKPPQMQFQSPRVNNCMILRDSVIFSQFLI